MSKLSQHRFAFNARQAVKKYNDKYPGRFAIYVKVGPNHYSVYTYKKRK